ncbi:manganese efflux pump [Methylophilus sp. 13]|uniref:manganese efflux pump n=1 Tax=Methylophilus sp. 13 TaxID=2781018 RepID=UPI00188FB554|nr:manganese efflux pump [Methylophilus sp. 13]
MACEGKNLTERLQEIEVFLYSFWPAYDLQRLPTRIAQRRKPTEHDFYILAVATRIDTMAVGVSLAFMDVNIFITAAARMINLSTQIIFIYSLYFNIHKMALLALHKALRLIPFNVIANL